MKTKQIGDIGETAAAKFLKKNGYKIIERNLHISHNELDIIAIHKKQNIICFVEVKSRTVDDDLYSKFGTPASAVSKEKQTRTIEAARSFLAKNVKYLKFQPRLDVIEIFMKKETLEILNINHIENAFGV
jgi:putative endonuclease